MHIAYDLIYGARINPKAGLRAEALSSSRAVLTCLANDLGYDIYAEQLRAKACQGDVLICFSGSRNSKNISLALNVGKSLKMKTFTILGFDGGFSKIIADVAIYFPVGDIQISEDLQLIVGHMCMKWLRSQ
jgi:D-sedoheptulose 7-phosphate isomerase